MALVIICFLNYMGTKAQGAEGTCPRSQSKNQEDSLDPTLSAMIGKQVPGSQLCQLAFSPWHCSSHPLCTSSINSHPWKKKKHLPPKRYLLLPHLLLRPSPNSSLFPDDHPQGLELYLQFARSRCHFLHKTLQTHKGTATALFSSS